MVGWASVYFVWLSRDAGSGFVVVIVILLRRSPHVWRIAASRCVVTELGSMVVSAFWFATSYKSRLYFVSRARSVGG